MINKYGAVTPYLVFTVCVYLLGAILYGVDTGSFGSLQALPSFTSKFGYYDTDLQAYTLRTGVRAAMNSIPFAGQALGAFLSSNVVDFVGYKFTMVVLAIIQLIAIIVELTSNFTGSWGQFTAGRFLAYLSTGLAEMAVTHYNSEISPASCRGLVAGSMIFFNALGNLWGSGMSRAYATETTAKGWLIPQGVQMLPAVLVLCLIWFTPESPRWLVLKNRREQALHNLNRLRLQRDIDNGITGTEIDAIELSIQEAGGHDTGRWIDLFRGDMPRRTWIAWSLFVFLQFTGVQFVNSFGATFYVNEGLAAKSFTYIVIGNVMQIISCLFQIFMYDYIGRRFFAIFGGLFCFIFLSIVSTLGTWTSFTSTSINALIASVILVQTFSRWAVTNAFVIGAEIGGVKMRRKVMATSGIVNMSSAIVITASVPYLMADLGASVGWFFAAPSFLLFLFGVFIIPELKGRSLEETDELFNAGLKWGWQFGTYKTRGTGAQIAALENEDHEKIRKLSAVSVDINGNEKRPSMVDTNDIEHGSMHKQQL